MNIILIGYRGTGKSSIGKTLAEKLNRHLISMDEVIVKKGKQSIPDMVAEHGWGYFRNLESEVAAEVAKKDNCIIDCGGGVILRDENVKNLKTKGKFFLLKADIDTIISRIQGDVNRPSLKKGMTFREEQEKVLKERAPKYQTAADVEIDTSILSINQAVEKILKHI